MKMTKILKFLSLCVCVVLIAAMALCMTACNDNVAEEYVSSGITENKNSEVVKLGEGSVSFDFTVVDSNAKETVYQIGTDKTTVGEALLELELIAGEDSQYGLYVKTVNGITLDYDKDGMYWAFYVNDQYATSGVETTEIKSGESYMFKAEK